MQRKNISVISGRGYFIEDGNLLMSLGVGSGLISTVVLILYTGSELGQHYYATPKLLVFLAPFMLYWISRIWLLAKRGKIKCDPILFVLKDYPSFVVLFCFILLMILSIYLVL